MAMEDPELCFPLLLNSSCVKPQSHTLETVTVYAVLSVVSLLTAILNLPVIISIVYFRKLHSPTNLILLSLAVSDFFIGLVVLPVEIFMWNSCWLLGDLLCFLYFLLPITLLMTSITSMVFISVDRYVAICDPMHYHTRMTMKRVSITICICWIYSIDYALAVLYENYNNLGKYKYCQGECVVNLAGIMDLVMGYFLPISTIVVLYMRVFVVAVFQARAMRCQVAIVTLHTKSKKSEIKAGRNLGILVLVFLMCYSPYYIALTGQSNLLGTSFEVVLIFVMYVNSCINPIMYAMFYPWFRKTTKIIITLQIFTPGARDLNVD